MAKSILNNKKGVAGLDTYLSLIAMLFMIGIIVMVFLIAGNKLASATYDTTSATANNETLTGVDEAGVSFAVSGYREVSCGDVATVYNSTNTAISSGNYTQTGCLIAFSGDDTAYNNTNWKVTYSYSYKGSNDVTASINQTGQAIKTSTDFFPTFIVLGSLIVLVLLTVVIINSIRATGITQEGA